MISRFATCLPIFLLACGGPDRIHFLELPVNSDIADSPGNSQPLEVLSLRFEEESPVILAVGDEMALTVQAMFSNGQILEKPDAFWFSNNPSVATVDGGVVLALASGSTVIKASVGPQSAQMDLIVTEEPSPEIQTVPQQAPSETPASPEAGPAEVAAPEPIPDPIVPETPRSNADYFLSANDRIAIRYGVNGGYGSHLFPAIVYGMPRTGGTHVVSFGGGGSLSVQLNNFIVADGPGPDFTIFENPIHSDFYGIFVERARVSVSEDGITYYDFPCDVWDPEEIYEGCAGVAMVNALANPLDPRVSGGDSFDLADVGLRTAKFLRIEDLNTCVPDDPTYLAADGRALCWVPGEQGFDLDAMAIVNGINE